MLTSSKPDVAATDLNDRFSALAAKRDTFFKQIDKNADFDIMKAVTDWQDYYYSDAAYDKWQLADLNKWDKILSAADNLLTVAVEKSKAKPVAPPPPSHIAKKTPVHTAPPVTVYGKVTKPVPKPVPPILIPPLVIPPYKKIIIDVDSPIIYDPKKRRPMTEVPSNVWGKIVAAFLGGYALYKSMRH